MSAVAQDERLDVLDVVFRCTAAIDARDWAQYRAVFSDEIDLDYSSYRPGSAGLTPADAWVARAQALFPGLDASQHTVTNCRVELGGDRAEVRSYVRADHLLAGRRYTLGGTYTHHLTRGRTGWRICGVTLTKLWDEGDRGVLADAVAAGRD